ncbi:zinc-binding dehydrogenase [Ramlibacter sp. G-1-2-2]|uniref:Zinc-binding dehydrogenase n=2 Tax=Ramlibacter agri TaxID=2728837 RepID=A0A848HIE3_9BURK|nr:zinc-binding dehydrogenase [Ramlibacter agri]
MQSWWMQASDAGVSLEQREVPVPQAGAGQVLVRMHAAGLNRGELLAFRESGGKPGAAKAAGGEGAGEVVSVGAGVTTLSPGDRVMGRAAGAFAQYALMEANEAMPMPGELSWEQAAGIPLTFLVAFDMLVLKGQLQQGEWLLVNGVSSGVGVACVQLAKAIGAQVIGTSGSQAKLDRLKPLGLDVGLAVPHGGEFAQAVLAATDKKGANLAINTVGGTAFEEEMRALAFEGRLAMVGHVDGVLRAEIDLELLHRQRLTLFGVSNKLRSKAQRASGIPRFVAEVLPHFAAGRIVPLVDEVYSFAQLPAAKERMEADQHVGKLVLRIVGD